MNEADRALLAEIAERDRECTTQFSDGYHCVMDKNGYVDGAAKDRRELLRILREQEARIDVLEGEAEYAVGALNDPEVLGAIAKGRLKAVLGWDTQAEDLADDAAATEATRGRWGGG